MSSFFFGPHNTPKSIKRIIILIIASSLLSPVISFYLKYLNIKGLLDFLPLTLIHIKQGYFFELFTYPLVQSTNEVISFSFLWSLSFQMFLFWIAGSELLLRLGGKKFLFLFLSGILIPAAGFILSQYFIGDFSTLVGTWPLLFCLLTVLALEVGALEFRIFLFISFPLRKLIYLFLGISLLINLSQGEFSLFFSKVAGIGWGILFSKFSLKLPFSFLRKKKKCEIIEVTAWEQSTDDAFMDQMLDKISVKGRGALTEKERKRLDEIVKKRKQ